MLKKFIILLISIFIISPIAYANDDIMKFVFSAHNGDIATVEEMLINGMNVNAQEKTENMTALMLAANTHRVEIVELLLAYKANVNIKDKDGLTAIVYNVYSGNAQIAKLLLNAKAKVNDRNRSGDTILMYAASHGFTDYVKVLLEHKVKINERAKDGSTALKYAIIQEKKEIAQLLLDNNANVHYANNRGYTPLMNAAQHGYVDIAKQILAKKADINAKADIPKNGNGGVTALILACMYKQKEMVELLLAHNAEVNVYDYIGLSPYLWAASKHSLEIMKLLEANNADIDFKYKDNSAFVLAQYNENINSDNIDTRRQKEVLKHILETNPNVSQEEIRKVFISVCSDNNLDTASFILPYLKDKSALNNALGYAILAKNKNLVEYLLKNGADINAPSYEGLTPLFIAIEYGGIEWVNYVLSKKANLHALCNEETALIYAIVNSSVEVVKYLISLGVDVNYTTDYVGHWNTALKVASLLYDEYENDIYLEMLDILKKAGAKE